MLRPSTTEATALGAAALAGVGAGVFGTLSDLQESLRAASSVDPGKSLDWRRQQRAAWQDFVARQTSR